MGKIFKYKSRAGNSTPHKFIKKPVIAKIIVAAIFIGFAMGLYFPFDIFQTNDALNVPQGNIKGFAEITDGDTIKINGRRIRFHGADAPEINQPCEIEGRQYQCGVEAKAYLNHIINNQTVTCQTISEDQYGRDIAKCYNYKNINLGAEMVLNGHAVAYTYYSWDYVIEEAKARYYNVGIWRGTFIDPYEFRNQN
tara:strand:- start:460 stop:1044 length:585 start_codon:yes stop_codon:yes gene_type:complete